MTGRGGSFGAHGPARADAAAIDLIDAFCDAVPRRLGRAEPHGPLVLFVTEGQGWSYYARPRRPPREPVTAEHLRGLRARQRELGVQESFEWIEQTAPEFAVAARAAALEVAAHPLMLLDGPARHAGPPAGVTVRAVPADEPDLASIVSVPSVAFAHPGTGTGPAGSAERDKLAAERSAARIARSRGLLAAGHSVLAAAFGADGPLAAGSCQMVGGVAEITGVGTLPSARRRGLGAAVTAQLAELAIGRGTHTVFLSASDEEVARVYAGIGFRRIGTAMIAEAPR
ncbi:MAG TPA: GNAT family N-acetyltransferase [Streptosporangiaceae bacterium]